MSEILINQARNILNQFWGHDTFYPEQEKIILSILKGNDLVALLPTGAGKSICFQVPALLKEGTCIVISPLIALIEDQIARLQSIGIAAKGVHSGQDPKIQNEILYDFSKAKIKLLYISPERLQSESFRSFLKNSKVSFIAIDEAHCISQWGYDFRPEYRKIYNIRDLFPNIQICAFTATANSKTLQDIRDYLHLRGKTTFRSSFLKENIRFGAIHTESKLKVLTLLLTEFQGSGIIYMRSRNGTEILSHKLNQFGMNTRHYHAGMSADERFEVQHKWIGNEYRIIVSTNAFGMGIDKPDVRFVVHFDLPASMEEYYQEAGRGGRDKKMSDAVVIYHKKDILNLYQREIELFPDIHEIRDVYNGLLKFFRYSQDRKLRYDFELRDFLKALKIDKKKIVRALSELERYGLIEFNISPARNFSLIQILLNNKELNQKENENKTHSDILNFLIFNINGIFSSKKPFSEHELALKTGYDQDIVIKSLIKMSDDNVVIYEQRNNKISLIINPVNEFSINEEELNFRRKRLESNYNQIKSYLEFKDCRQKFILNYFDEKLKKDCDICDHCLKSEDTNFTDSEYNIFLNELTQSIDSGNDDLDSLLFFESYLKRSRNKNILKKIIESQKFTISGRKIKKI
jgi:ATP-dependent DNA helicase RecQ